MTLDARQMKIVERMKGVNGSAEPLAIPRVESSTPTLPNCEPRTLASDFIDGRPTLTHWRGEMYEHTGSVYRRWELEEVKSDLAQHLAAVRYVGDDKDGEPVVNRYVVNTRRIHDVIESMRNLTQARVQSMPAWLNGEIVIEPEHVLTFMNGLVSTMDIVADGPVKVLPPTPNWFSKNVLPYRYDPRAPRPVRWLAFLASLWAEDQQSIDTLQEWFGLMLTLDTRLQKILMLVGPQRSGKGTICRILTALVGVDNVAGPTLTSLAGQYGLWAIHDKQLAIVSDARLSGRTDQAIIIERLLSISGEDRLDIERKYLGPIQACKMPTRLMLVSNELPKLSDSSGALADRFLILSLQKSFLGNENVTLTDDLMEELPGVLLWAIDGLKRLARRGRFIMPQSSVDAVQELQDLASPIKAFIRERCIVEAGRCAGTTQLFMAWQSWCTEQGRDHAGNVQTFGRDLKAALPHLKIRHSRESESRVRVYEGIDVQ